MLDIVYESCYNYFVIYIKLQKHHKLITIGIELNSMINIMKEAEVLEETTSTWIDELIYNDSTESVSMKIKDGQRYTIDAFPKELYDDWIAAASAGSFYHANVKDVYTIS